MMTASLHCNHATRHDVVAEWVRSHGGEPKGGQDYFRVTIAADGGEIVLFLSAKQVDGLADKLRAAAYDRDVVLAEEAMASAPLELASGG